MSQVSLLQRLRERKFVQWALAYLAGAWVIYEVTATVGSSWGLQDTFLQGLFVVLGIGFLITLVLAWYHGEEGRQRVSGPELLMVAALLVVAGIALTLLPGERSTGPVDLPIATPEDDRPSIAVLPFQNRSGLEEDAYFTDGMHDQIITHLTKIRGLSVRGLTSVLVYRGSPKNNRQIGQELNAKYIVEGGVQRAGGVVRINIQLIEAATDHHLWASTLDRAMSVENVLAIQTEIVEAVTDSVRAVVTPQEKTEINIIPTENLDAYNLYLLGRHRWSGRSVEGIQEAVDHFQGAIHLDPEFALAYAGLADALGTLPWYDRSTTSADVYDRARAAAAKALELAPNSGEAHTASGYIALAFELDWPKANHHLTTAINRAPGYPTARFWYSNLLSAVGMHDEAVVQAEIARSLDPSSPVIVWSSANQFWAAKRVSEARQRWGLGINMRPLIPWAFLNYGLCMGLDEPRDPETAGELLGRFVSAFGYTSPQRMLVVAQGMGGSREARIRADEVLQEIVADSELSRADLIALYFASAPVEVFLEVLREAMEERHFWVPWAAWGVRTYRPDITQHPGWKNLPARVREPDPGI